MTANMLIAAGCTVWGLIAGGVLALTYSAAAMSRSQERMQRKVRLAWEEARCCRAQFQQAQDSNAQNQWEFW
jgi:xanthine/CO dehydrogenase XdhC/CoxF family maturation factor